jgi:hypothetical protein
MRAKSGGLRKSLLNQSSPEGKLVDLNFQSVSNGFSLNR